MENEKILKLGADNIRVLAAEAVQKANSGHPGMPMGCADFAFTLWFNYLRYNPMNPEWIGRDRFVLSAGHGSMLIYSLLHLFEYGLSMDEIKNFRQWGSLTPGHPEYGLTKGVEVTTGPLGSGFASAVGMAIEAKNFIARTGLDKTNLFKNQKIYVLCSDGCLMEGCSHEAASLAGHLKLDNIICFYDSNLITIEGSTSLAYSDNVEKRFESYGWRVINIDNANDISQICKGLDEAIISDGRPTILIGKTEIAFGSPNKHGKNTTHGEPLGAEEVAAVKKQLGFPEEAFYVYPELRAACHARVEALVAESMRWDAEFNKFLEENRDSAKMISALLLKHLPDDLLDQLKVITPIDKPMATRVSGSIIMQKAAHLVPALAGGAADLAPSTKTIIVNDSSFSSENRAGRNLHFGIREFGMGLTMNGMALYGTAIPYGATFLVFADYMKPAIRLSAIQNLHVIYIFTHDSICVGEDGPTHQPIEQLNMLRTIPNVTVIRPADANEIAHAWNATLKLKGPVCLVLTRQNVDPIPKELAERIDVQKGAYILKDSDKADIIIIATGSEVILALNVSDLLAKENINARVISMPSRELFLKQEKSYRESVLPSSFKNRVSIEFGTTFGWREFVEDTGLSIGIDRFGASAPQKVLEKKFGFTKEQIADKIKTHFNLEVRSNHRFPNNNHSFNEILKKS